MASASSSTAVLSGLKIITVDFLGGKEIVLKLDSNAFVKELRDNIARIKLIAPESFRLIYNGMVLDEESRLSACIEESEAQVTLVIMSEEYTNEHKRCISCLKPHLFWATELVCRKCWIEQVHAVRAHNLDGLDDS